MSEQSTGASFRILISLQRAFLASPSRVRAAAVELAMRGSYGPSLPDCLGRYDPDSHCWKMSQASFPWMGAESSDGYSVSWPRSGLMLRGTAYPLQPLARCIGETESGLLPTPRASRLLPDSSGSVKAWERLGIFQKKRLWPTPCAQEDQKSVEAHLAMKARMKGGPRSTITSLSVMVKLWPTPHSNCHTGAGAQGRDGGLKIQTAIAKWPTPTSRDHKDTGDLLNVPTNGLLG